MDVPVDKSRLPRWGWLLLGLFVASVIGQLLNAAILEPVGLPQSYHVVTVIGLMAPVLIYVGLWYDEERQGYWEHSRAWILGDLSFVIVGTILGASIVLLAIDEVGVGGILRDVIGMAGGFLCGWGLFWWRNPGMYRNANGQ